MIEGEQEFLGQSYIKQSLRLCSPRDPEDLPWIAKRESGARSAPGMDRHVPKCAEEADFIDSVGFCAEWKYKVGGWRCEEWTIGHDGNGEECCISLTQGLLSYIIWPSESHMLFLVLCLEPLSLVFSL